MSAESGMPVHGALEAELARQLEHLGVPGPEAERIARRQLAASADPSRPLQQHVVPVSRGWVVVRDLANIDIGLFDSKSEALAEARNLAAAAGNDVVVHDEDA
jgi:hypothetical protein